MMAILVRTEKKEEDGTARSRARQMGDSKGCSNEQATFSQDLEIMCAGITHRVRTSPPEDRLSDGKTSDHLLS